MHPDAPGAHRRALCWFSFVLTMALCVPVQAGERLSESDLSTLLESAPLKFKPKTGAPPKVGKALQELHADFLSFKKRKSHSDKAAFKARSPMTRLSNGHVVIDAIAKGDPEALKEELVGLGLKHAAVFGQVVSGLLPIEAIERLPECRYLNVARPALAATNVGLVTSQGDVAQRSDVARSGFGVDGSGVTVGVLSDSFDCLGGAAADAASGDLPPLAAIDVLDDAACPASDEGRAMMQIVRDVAPGASLSFHTAFLGVANFAQGILDLAAAGADIITDDIIYFAEPMFQDGPIAQAVDAVRAAGVAYFSSAGNDARQSYENPFRGVVADGFEFHDFDPGAGVDLLQRVFIPAGGSLLISFQWDSPAASAGGPGSPNDLDIYLTDDPATVFLAASTEFNLGLDPVEILFFQNTSGVGRFFNLLIHRAIGPDPGKIKYVRFSDSIPVEFDTQSSASFGHANAAGAEAVGATFWANTPAFGVTPPALNFFSSRGGTPILFDTAGNPLPAPEIRDKPGVVGPDGGGTTFFGGGDVEPDGFLDFFGTSASVAHVAGAAALLKSANPALTPAEIIAALRNTALDMDDPDTGGFDTGFDFATGFGFIQADLALQSVLGGNCDLVVNPLTLDFGSRNVGDTGSLPVELSNEGSGDCEIFNVSLMGSGDFQFTAPAPVTPFTIPPGEMETVSVDHTPSDAGADAGVLTLTSNDPDDGTIEVELAGTGLQALMESADLKVRNYSNRRRVRVGSTLTYTIKVKNRGPDNATGIVVENTLPDSVDFVAASSGCTPDSGTVVCQLSSLMDGGSKRWNIVVRPTEKGRIVNRVRVSGNEDDPRLRNNRARKATRVR